MLRSRTSEAVLGPTGLKGLATIALEVGENGDSNVSAQREGTVHHLAEMEC